MREPNCGEFLRVYADIDTGKEQVLKFISAGCDCYESLASTLHDLIKNYPLTSIKKIQLCLIERNREDSGHSEIIESINLDYIIKTFDIDRLGVLHNNNFADYKIDVVFRSVEDSRFFIHFAC